VTGNASVTVPLRTLHRQLGPGPPPVQDRGVSYYTHNTLNTVLAVVSFILNFPSPLPCLLLSRHNTPLFSTAPKTSVMKSAPSGPHVQTRLRSRSSPPVSVEAIVRLHSHPRPPLRPRMLTYFSQSIIMSMAGTATSSSRRPWSSVTNPLAS